MMDNADPIAGWPLKSFMELDIGPAKNDVYGKLYYYLKHLLADFHGRMRSLPTTFELLHMDARFLPESLAGRHFDRIDVGILVIMH
jgi:hypothetical protein